MLFNVIIYIEYYFYRKHNESAIKLRKVLSKLHHDIRHRRNLINIHITILGWLVEFFGFFLIALGSFILGHGSPIRTLFLQAFTSLFYFVCLPCTILINATDLKITLAENQYYKNILSIFDCNESTVNQHGDDLDNDENVMYEGHANEDVEGQERFPNGSEDNKLAANNNSSLETVENQSHVINEAQEENVVPSKDSLAMEDVNDKGEEQNKNVEDETLDPNTDSTLEDAKILSDISNEIPTHKQFNTNNSIDL